jgi:apolipoprotein N-acyltransferase
MSFLARIGERLRGLAGWRRLLVAFASGAFSALGFEPIAVFPALLLGYAALVLLIDSADAGPKPVRRAALVGWAFLFGQFLIGLHWIVYPFLVDPENHLWQAPFALVMLPAGLALFGAFAGALAAYFWQEGPARAFVLAVMMALAEWLRGHLLTGFPWNLSGYGWGASLAVLQSASLFGIYGLSFLTILLGASLAELTSGRWRIPAAMAVIFVGLWGFGVYRLSTTPTRNISGVEVRLVQPAIPQTEKFVRQYLLRNWRRLVTLSIAPPDKGKPRPTHIVWPEAATGFAVARSSGALDQIALLTMRGQTLLTGSVRVDRGADGERAWYNSLYIFPAGGALPSVYDKFHLVPFGEYVPYAATLARIGITQVTTGEGATPGDHPHVLDVPGAPQVTPLICYEVIFPHEVIDTSGPRPGWLVNVTDDSWFGPWAGPRQHLLIARVRAIEEGLPIARAANTGISAMIDASGRIRNKLDLNRTGFVDSQLPTALPPTPYSRFGDLVFLIFLVTGALAAFALARTGPSAKA